MDVDKENQTNNNEEPKDVTKRGDEVSPSKHSEKEEQTKDVGPEEQHKLEGSVDETRKESEIMENSKSSELDDDRNEEQIGVEGPKSKENEVGDEETHDESTLDEIVATFERKSVANIDVVMRQTANADASSDDTEDEMVSAADQKKIDEFLDAEEEKMQEEQNEGTNESRQSDGVVPSEEINGGENSDTASSELETENDPLDLSTKKRDDMEDSSSKSDTSSFSDETEKTTKHDTECESEIPEEVNINNDKSDKEKDQAGNSDGSQTIDVENVSDGNSVKLQNMVLQTSSETEAVQIKQEAINEFTIADLKRELITSFDSCNWTNDETIVGDEVVSMYDLALKNEGVPQSQLTFSEPKPEDIKLSEAGEFRNY